MLKQSLIVAGFVAALIPVAANAGEVQNRINDQQARINAGVRNGSLTYGEYHGLDSSLDGIAAQRDRDLRANGGRLTSGEYAQLNREENNLSDRIWFDEHNRFRQ